MILSWACSRVRMSQGSGAHRAADSSVAGAAASAATERYPRGGGRAHTGAQSDEVRSGDLNAVATRAMIVLGAAAGMIAGADTPVPLQSLHSCLQPWPSPPGCNARPARLRSVALHRSRRGRASKRPALPEASGKPPSGTGGRRRHGDGASRMPGMYLLVRVRRRRPHLEWQWTVVSPHVDRCTCTASFPRYLLLGPV